MAKIIKVNTVRLKNDAETVNSCIKSMRKSIESIKSLSVQLDSMWDGEAGDVFNKELMKDIKDFERNIKNLEKIYKFEEKAHEGYESCEKKVDQVVAGIKI